MTTDVTARGAERWNESTLVLGIETSCDETAAALVLGGVDVVSSVVSSQVDLHAEYGGVVPEVATRPPRVARPRSSPGRLREGGDRRSRRGGSPHGGTGLVGAVLVGAGHGKALAVAGTSRSSVSTTSRATCYSAFLEPRPPTLGRSRSPFVVTGGHTLPRTQPTRGHGDTDCSATRSTTPPARRSTRSRACWTSATRRPPAIDGSAPGRPDGVSTSQGVARRPTTSRSPG